MFQSCIKGKQRNIHVPCCSTNVWNLWLQSRQCQFVLLFSSGWFALVRVWAAQSCLCSLASPAGTPGTWGIQKFLLSLGYACLTFPCFGGLSSWTLQFGSGAGTASHLIVRPSPVSLTEPSSTLWCGPGLDDPNPITAPELAFPACRDVPQWDTSHHSWSTWLVMSISSLK